MSRQIAVIGLGLIGGSIAMGLKEFEDFKRVGVDVSQPTLRYALEQGIVDQVCEDPREALAQADLVFLCMHPRGIQEFLSEHRDHFRPGSLVTDVCGVKGAIVDAARTLPSSVSFLGGHPMAGTEFSGIQHALPNMFQGAHYILTPGRGDPAGASCADGAGGQAPGLCRCGAHHPGAARCHHRLYQPDDAHHRRLGVRRPQPVRLPGLRGGLLPGLHPGGRPGRPLWTQLFSLNAPALTQALETLEDNLRLYRQVIQSGDTRQLADKLAFSAARKRKMNQLEAERGATGRGA